MDSLHPTDYHPLYCSYRKDERAMPVNILNSLSLPSPCCLSSGGLTNAPVPYIHCSCFSPHSYIKSSTQVQLSAVYQDCLSAALHTQIQPKCLNSFLFCALPTALFFSTSQLSAFPPAYLYQRTSEHCLKTFAPQSVDPTLIFCVGEPLNLCGRPCRESNRSASVFSA